MQSPIQPPQIIRPKPLCKQLGISQATLYRMIKRGDLPPQVRLSTQAVGWDVNYITRLVESRKEALQ